MKTFRYLAVAAALLLAAAPAGAGPIVLGTGSPNGFLTMESEQWGAQAFTLTSTLDLESFEIGFIHGNAFTSRVQLVEGTPGSGNTLFDATFSDVANSGLSFLHESYSFAAAMTLLPGSYYIVATNINSPNFGWSFGTSQVASTVGTIGTAYACLDANSPNGCNDADPKASLEWSAIAGTDPLDFRLVAQDTDATPAPEPATVTLVLLGGALAAAHRKRAHKN
jgi:hypothetical protein